MNVIVASSRRLPTITHLSHFKSSDVRHFSLTSARWLRTSELKPSQLNWFKANSSRLWSDIHSTAKWGEANRYGDQSEQTGLSRLTLSDDDRRARDWFCETVRSLSCKVHVDEVGNIFAVRPGLNNDVPATFVGSHLDSQPMGGRFDGILGVCAGIEMLRVLDENHIETEGPTGVINWCNEEGARFPVSMMGSGVWAGKSDLVETYDLKEVSTTPTPKTFLQELDRIGYKGSVKAHWNDGIKLGGHFELHIEQGFYLEKNKQSIGVVEGGQAYKWFELNVQGQSSHTGTTGYEHRADALWAASQIIYRVRGIAEKANGLASVGVIKSEPQSINTVPDRVMFTLDVRHAEDKVLHDIITSIKSCIAEVQDDGGIQGSPRIDISMKETFSNPATVFDGEAVKCVEDGALSTFEATGETHPAVRRMISGAGHDSINTQLRCPTAMVFIPCKDGISHNPREWSSEDDCATGATVLMQAVMRFDRLRHSKGHFDL